MKTRLQALLVAAALAALASGVHAQGKLYKWTDASGKVHYTDKMPVEASGRASEELNKQGTVVRRTEAPLSAEQRAEFERRLNHFVSKTAAGKQFGNCRGGPGVQDVARTEPPFARNPDAKGNIPQPIH